MITTAKQEDIPALTRLWMESFQDEEAGVNRFMEARFRPEQTLLYREGGAVEAALYLLEGALRTAAGQAYPAYYIYAACTRPHSRSRGYMGMLLEAAAEQGIKDGKSFLALVPASEGLFRYYGQRGFTTAFSKKELCIGRQQLQRIAAPGAVSCQPSATAMAALWGWAFEGIDCFLWDAVALDYALSYHGQYGGKAVFCEKEGQLSAFALFCEEEGACLVTECCAPEGSFPRLAALLLEQTDLDFFRLQLPLCFPLSADACRVVQTGMLRPLTREGETAMSRLKNAYIGFTLE